MDAEDFKLVPTYNNQMKFPHSREAASNGHIYLLKSSYHYHYMSKRQSIPNKPRQCQTIHPENTVQNNIEIHHRRR